MSETVKAWVYTGNQGYSVWAPADLVDLINDDGWVSLALVEHDEYICLRARDITLFQRQMTAAEIQRRHTLEKP